MVSFVLIILLLAYLILYNNFADIFTVPKPSAFVIIVWFAAILTSGILKSVFNKMKPIKNTKVKVLSVRDPSRSLYFYVTFLFPDGKKRSFSGDKALKNWRTLIKGEIVYLKYQGNRALSIKKAGVRPLPEQPSHNDIIGNIGVAMLTIFILYSVAAALYPSQMLPEPSKAFTVVYSIIVFIFLFTNRVIEENNRIIVTIAKVLEIKENNKGTCTIVFMFSDKKKHTLKAAKNECKPFKKGDSVELTFHGGTVCSMLPLIAKPNKPIQSPVKKIDVK